jgi:hypothetical protein
MFLEAMFVAWLSAQMDSRDCFITGEVSTTEEQGFNLEATIGCPIKIERKGKLIKLTSPKYIVEITIPEAAGAQKFQYQWGQSEATIGGQTVQISFREVGGG